MVKIQITRGGEPDEVNLTHFGTIQKTFGTKPAHFGTIPKMFGTKPAHFGTIQKTFGTKPAHFGTIQKMFGTKFRHFAIILNTSVCLGSPERARLHGF